MTKVMRFFRDEEGISSLEYALLAVVVALVIWVGARTFGTSVSNLFDRIATALDGVNPPALP